MSSVDKLYKKKVFNKWLENALHQYLTHIKPKNLHKKSDESFDKETIPSIDSEGKEKIIVDECTRGIYKIIQYFVLKNDVLILQRKVCKYKKNPQIILEHQFYKECVIHGECSYFRIICREDQRLLPNPDFYVCNYLNGIFDGYNLIITPIVYKGKLNTYKITLTEYNMGMVLMSDDKSNEILFLEMEISALESEGNIYNIKTNKKIFAEKIFGKGSIKTHSFLKKNKKYHITLNYSLKLNVFTELLTVPYMNRQIYYYQLEIKKTNGNPKFSII